MTVAQLALEESTEPGGHVGRAPEIDVALVDDAGCALNQKIVVLGIDQADVAP